MVDTKKFGAGILTVEQKLSDFPAGNLCHALGRVLLPQALVAVVERLKVAESLLHALGSIEQIAWEDHLQVAVSRVDAFALSAVVYEDLSQAEWAILDNHIREREAARRALLNVKFGELDADKIS